MPRSLQYFAAFTGMGTLFAGTLLLAALALGDTTSARGSDATPTPIGQPAEGEILGTIEIRAFDVGFEPTLVSVEQPGRYEVVFSNDGGAFHDLVFADGTTLEAAARETATGEIEIPAEGLSFICSVPGHADAGMQGEVVIGDDPHAGHPTPSLTPEEMRDRDAARTALFPAETEGKGGVPLEPTVLDDGTLQWELTASEIEWETEPGIWVEAMAYNGIVPGPELRADVGDQVRIILHNELSEPTTIHFHGLLVPNAMDGVPFLNQEAVLPGESFTYEFEIRNAGSHMYHSHFMAEHQVPMGLLGAFITTDPTDEADPVADIDYTMILNDGPLGYTINGKGFPATEPIVAQFGETIRVRYMNEGLQIHPMHLHGIAQQVIARDGYLLPHPYYEDTVLVSPGERVDILVEANELGVWAFHCHVLTHAEGPDGMFGMVTALIVQE